MRRSARRLVAALGALLVTFGLAETAVRVAGVVAPLPSQYVRFVDDPILPYRLQPSSEIHGRSASDEFDFHYAHSSLGFRDRERERAKPDGTFRILGLGDSFTYGAGVDEDQTYLAQLERALTARAQRGRAIEIVRAGVPRFFTGPERLLYEHDGAAMDPDLVLLGFVPNDVVDTAVGANRVRVTADGRLISTELAAVFERFGGASRWMYERSQLARLALRAWLRRTRTHAEAAPRLGDVYLSDGPLEAAWLEVERELTRLARTTRDDGVPLVVVHLPQRPPWPEDRSYVPGRLARWARSEGVAFVDTLPALREEARHDDLYWPIDGHPRARGHGVFAEVLAKELAQRGLVP
ncbi:MAG: GDSL-type esterase/lipase family protein [Planctomycetota bacterium]